MFIASEGLEFILIVLFIHERSTVALNQNCLFDYSDLRCKHFVYSSKGK